MQIGVITVGGMWIGSVTLDNGPRKPLQSIPDIYIPMGRAEERSPGDYAQGQGYAKHSPHPGRRAPAAAQPRDAGDLAAATAGIPPQETSTPGKTYESSGGGGRTKRASPEVDAAIVAAAKANNLDPDMMRAVASIESSNNPDSNRNKSTKYKGLYQIGSRGEGNEWERFGSGDIYDAKDNAMAAGRMFAHNRDAFAKKFGRAPTDTEMYMMHQQGLGFYTRGAMTNIAGNPYPGMSGPQTHDSFEEGWGREIARRKEAVRPAAGDAAGGPAEGGLPAGAIATGNKPAAKPGVSAAGVDPRIDEIVRAGATHLPPGYSLRMTSGYRGPNQHNHNGRAADYQIIDPNGNALRNRGEDPTGMYQELARHAYGEQKARYPELNGKFAWGGAFGTALGGGGERDLMHFDINGERGRYTQYQLRNLGPVPGVQYGDKPQTQRTADSEEKKP